MRLMRNLLRIVKSSKLARKELNLRPASYKDAALTAELRASSWVGGIRTRSTLIKSQVCNRYTTTQCWFRRIRLFCNTVDMLFLIRSS
jgi:hypothetical protein